MFVLVNICSGYLYDYEPELISSDYRLAAMGGLDLVIRNWDNELNMHDFGESPAGLIEDNEGYATLYLPGAYGFTSFDDVYGESNWDGYAVSFLGVAPKTSSCAAAFSFNGSSSDIVYDYVPYPIPYSYYYDNYRGMFSTAEKVSSRIIFGFQGRYDKRKTEHNSGSNHDSYEQDRYMFKPAVLVTFPNLSWHMGINYSLAKIGTYTTAHYVTIPFTCRSSRSMLGAKVAFGPIPHDNDNTWRRSIEVQSNYHIMTTHGSVDLGFLAMYGSPRMYEDFIIYSASGWNAALGAGAAYCYSTYGAVGVQYKLGIARYDVSEPFTRYQHRISLGAERIFFEYFPIRVGYAKIIDDDPHYTYPSQDILTAGFGVRVPGTRLEIDFAYNSEIIRDSYYTIWDEYVDYTNIDHLFGLSGRVLW
jgi:hypothetical protein